MFRTEFMKDILNLFVFVNQVQIPNYSFRRNPVKMLFVSIVDSVYFDILITTAILGNLAVMMLPYETQTETVVSMLKSISYIFSYFFVLECVLKIFVYGKLYFKQSWNILDFLVVCETIISMVLEQGGISYGFDSAILRVIRVGRILKLLKKARALNKTFTIFLNCIAGFFFAFVIYFLTIIIYAVVGMSLFSSIKFNGIYNETWNFDNFFNSFGVLFRISNGTGWKEFMRALAIDRASGFECYYSDELSSIDFECISLKR